MGNPRVIDFTAEAEDAITIKFKNGQTVELPTMDELTMPVFQFINANGDEWYELFEKSNLTDEERVRFDHLNTHLAYALCEEVPREVVDELNPKQKARMIVAFMTASPEMLEVARQAAEAQEKAAKVRKAKPKARTTA